MYQEAKSQHGPEDEGVAKAPVSGHCASHRQVGVVVLASLIPRPGMSPHAQGSVMIYPREEKCAADGDGKNGEERAWRVIIVTLVSREREMLMLWGRERFRRSQAERLDLVGNYFARCSLRGNGQL